MSTVILVRDHAYPIGGLESWSESLMNGLPSHGIDVICMVPFTDKAVKFESSRKLSRHRVAWIKASDDPVTQAIYLFDSLQSLIRDGVSGVFFTLAYPYVNIAGLNLIGSPIIPVPVMHGSSETAFPWIFAHSESALVVPSKALNESCFREAKARLGKWRARKFVRYIPHGVPVFNNLDPHLLQHSPLTLKIAAASRLNPDTKRPFDYIKIAKKLKSIDVNFSMTIAGDGPSLAAMRKEVFNFELAQQVSLTGSLNRNEVMTLMAASDIFLSTSESEAFGLSIAESLSVGTPVLSADIGGEVGRMVLEGQTGFLVPVGDIDAFSHRLAYLATHRKELHDMRKKAARLINDYYSDASMISSYAELISELSARVKSNPKWNAPEYFMTDPSQILNPGILTRMKIPSILHNSIRRIWKRTGL